MTRKKLEYLKDSVRNCRSREGASQADVDEVFANRRPTGRLARCVLACTLEEGGIVSRLYYTETVCNFFTFLSKF